MTVMFKLQSDYAVTIKKLYLAGLYARCVDEAKIDDINWDRKKYKLQYLGLSSSLSSCVLNLELYCQVGQEKIHNNTGRYDLQCVVSFILQTTTK